MHFPQQKCVFIHVPKTGGNFFTQCFLRYSDDNIATHGHQDGQDRFRLQGAATKTKHQSLAQYSKELGDRFSSYRVYAFVRPPLERMISLYYSPNRWMRKLEDGSFISETPNAPIVLDEFRKLVLNSRSVSELVDATNVPGRLTLNRPAVHASGAKLTLLSFAQFQRGIARFAKDNRFDLADMPSRKVNASSVAGPMHLNKEQMQALEETVLETHHKDDLRFFEPSGLRGFLNNTKNNLSNWFQGPRGQADHS